MSVRSGLYRPYGEFIDSPWSKAAGFSLRHERTIVKLYQLSMKLLCSSNVTRSTQATNCFTCSKLMAISFPTYVGTTRSVRVKFPIRLISQTAAYTARGNYTYRSNVILLSMAKLPSAASARRKSLLQRSENEAIRAKMQQQQLWWKNQGTKSETKNNLTINFHENHRFFASLTSARRKKKEYPL